MVRLLRMSSTIRLKAIAVVLAAAIFACLGVVTGGLLGRGHRGRLRGCDRIRPIGEEAVKGISAPIRICEYRPANAIATCPRESDYH